MTATATHRPLAPASRRSPLRPTAAAWARPVGPGHAVFGVAAAVTWLHLLDAAVVHPQANASLAEHVLLTLLALVSAPLAYLAYPRVSRAWRGALAALGGLVALTAGAVIHVVAVVRDDRWAGGDVTGAAMAVAGGALLVLGVVLIASAIPRARYRLLMVPGALVALVLVVFPIAMGTVATHTPRRVIEAANLGAAYEPVSFETDDGLTLRGWYVPSRNGAAVAVLHGSGSARTRTTAHVRMLVRHGYGVLVFDARGHGESDGRTNMLGWGAHPDLAAAADFLAARPDVRRGRTGVLGLSMGAEIAIEAAAHDDDGFAAIVADGPSGRTFADTREAGLSLPSRVLGYPPVAAMELAVSVLSRQLPPPGLTSLAPRVTEPVLYIASGRDPAERALVTKVAGRSGGEHELWVIDAGHTQGLRTLPVEYEARVIGFFDRLLRAD